ncbi:hypothetical protein ANN_22682 [Periplaneta americana]|uniref:Uncharacterized protein n=1 Tax=Periplaneta americana TaxID=6978 RepID=A0ABQ8S8V7_PERAM|nr:hypothetical protein ANN_22682 [Periplaneta americana]
MDGTAAVSRSKKIRNDKEDQRQDAKRLRNAGESYKDRSGGFIQSKIFHNVDCTCRKMCFQKRRECERKQLFKVFWKMEDFGKQNAYLLSDERLSGALKNYREGKPPGEDLRRRKLSPRKIDPHKITFIEQHINNFPVSESQYTRNDNVNRKYFSPLLNIRKMYDLYKEACLKGNMEFVKENDNDDESMPESSNIKTATNDFESTLDKNEAEVSRTSYCRPKRRKLIYENFQDREGNSRLEGHRTTTTTSRPTIIITTTTTNVQRPGLRHPASDSRYGMRAGSSPHEERNFLMKFRPVYGTGAHPAS